MGERGQIKMKNSGVYLYTHWRGLELQYILKSALSKRWRWHDEEYLTRIIFDEMSKGDHDTETGFGIGTEEHCDLNYPLIIVDCKNQTVERQGKLFTFEAFIEDKR